MILKKYSKAVKLTLEEDLDLFSASVSKSNLRKKQLRGKKQRKS